MTSRSPSTPLVSVIIPAFNASSSVSAAVDSALSQTGLPPGALEVIVIDDASTDDTALTVATIAQKDARVQLLVQPLNRGPSAARNLGIARAQGDWIALLDADDTFCPERLAALLRLAADRQADFVADNLLVHSADGSFPRPMFSTAELPAARQLTFIDFMESNIPHNNTRARFASFGFLQPMMRRGFLRSNSIYYDEISRNGEDFLFYADCFLKEVNWWITPDAMYNYYIFEGSLTDVQVSSDFQRLVEKGGVLAGHSLVRQNPALLRLVRRHHSIFSRYLYFGRFAAFLKACRFGNAIRLLFSSPLAFAAIVQEGGAQARGRLLKPPG